MRDVAAVVLAVLAVACDLPTELPKLQTRFLIPGEHTAVSVTELLPDSVRVEGDRFRVLIAPRAVAPRRLGDICGTACAPLHGLLVFKPAFTDSVAVVLPLPVDVTSATLTGGAVEIELVHDFGFDPLRPAGATQTGSLVVTLSSGAQVFGSATITDAFPSGVPLRRTIPLAGGAVTGDLRATVRLVSPAGGGGALDRVVFNSNASLRGTIAPEPVHLASANVRVANRQVSVDDVEVDLQNVDADVNARVRGGALVVLLANPFGVTGTLQLRLTAPGVDIVRSLAVAPGQTQQRVAFSEEEMRSILGRTIIMHASGPVTGQDEHVTVTPDQELGVTTRLELLLEIG